MIKIYNKNSEDKYIHINYCIKNTIYAIFCIMLIIYLFISSQEIKTNILSSLKICVDILIPSLFPFLIISGILSTTYCGYVLSYPLRPICKYIYGIPTDTAPALFTAFIGGYPAGINALIGLRDVGVIDNETCDKCSNFFIYSSPPFVITVIGLGVFNSIKAGIFIYGIHLLAGLCLRWITYPHIIKSTVKNKVKYHYEDIGSAIVHSVTKSINIITSMFGFVVISNVLLLVLKKIGLTNLLLQLFYKLTFGIMEDIATETLFSGFIEICSSIPRLQGLSYNTSMWIAPFIISFCGMCVIFQLKSLCDSNNINIENIVAFRFWHGILTTVLSSPIMYFSYRTLRTFVSQNTSLQIQNNKLMSILSLLGITIIVLSAFCAFYANILNYYKNIKIKHINERIQL